MELYQLQYFEAVARRGSLTAAANICHVSQPSLSVQVRRLEEELGARLFERRARGVSLTKAGERVLRTVRKIQGEVQDLRRDLRRRAYEEPSPLRLGVQPLLASETIALPLRRFMEGAEPGRVVVRERPQARLIEATLSEEVDLSFLALPPSLPESLEAKAMFSSSYGVFCPGDHPLARRRRVRLKDLLSHRLLLFSDASRLEERITTLAEKRGSVCDIVLSSDQALTVFEMACAGLGAAVLPLVASVRARRRKIAVVPILEVGLRARFGVVWRRAQGLPARAEALVEALSSAFPGNGGC